MNEYFLKVVSEKESLHHTIDFEIHKNEKLFWKVRRFTGRKLYQITTLEGDEIEVIRKWLLYPLLDVTKNKEPLYRINNLKCKFEGGKIYKDSRGFVYDGNEYLCSIDNQSRGWNKDTSIFLRWKHSHLRHEILICIFALLPQ